MKKSLTLTLILFAYANCFLAQNCALTGKVIDQSSHEPIAFANVSLFSAKDSSLVAGAITNDDGVFLLDHLKNGTVQVKMSFIGYQTVLVNNVLLQPGKRDMGDTELKILSENLKEICVKSTKPAMTYNVDRKVIDAGSFPGADAAIDLLENIPSVQLDMDGNLTYRGDGTFKVYINGHPVENGTEKLRQLPSSQIDKIEVITNPSAKYDAEGTAGIIQVILKKNRLEGYALNTSLVYNSRNSYRWMFSVDNKTEKSGWYIHGYLADVEWDNYHETTNQTILDGENTYVTTSDMEVKHSQKTSTIEIGFNYDVTDKDYIDFTAYIDPAKTRQKNKEKGWVTEQLIDANGTTVDSSYYLNSVYNCNYQYVGGGITYEHAFNKERTQLLSAYLNYSGYVADLYERQYDELAYDNSTEREGFIGSEQQETMIEGKLNYKMPLGDKTKIEAGVEIETDHIPAITSVSGTFDDNKDITKYDSEPLNQSVDFIQDVYASYLLFQHEGEKLALQMGARVEFTNRRSDYSYENANGTRSKTPDRNKFTDFFPSVHISYNFTETHQLYLSYSRRISRPGYWELVPLEQYKSTYSYYTGNGDVLPSYTNAMEAGYKKSWDKNFVSAEVFNRTTNNTMQNYTRTDGGNMLVISPENVGHSMSTGIELMGGVNIFSWWNSNLNASLYAYKLNVDFEDENYTQQQFKTDYRWNNTFLLPKNFTVKWDVKYNSPYKNVQSVRDAYYTSNIAIKKEFKDGKWNASFVYNDIFSSNEYNERQTGDDFVVNTYEDEKPYFSLKLAYTLDNQR